MASITISTTTISDCHFTPTPSAVYLRFYVLDPFMSSDGVQRQAAGFDSRTWYKQVTCTLSGTDLTIPQIVGVLSTTDGLDKTTARYGCAFYDQNGKRLGLYQGFDSFRLSHLTTSTSWQLIRQYNNIRATVRDDSTYTKDEVDARLASVVAGQVSFSTLTGNATDNASLSAALAAKADANAVVSSLAGTSNQVSVSASTGAVTLSLPQAIATSSSPTFAGLTATGGGTFGSNLTSGAAVSAFPTFTVNGSTSLGVDARIATSASTGTYIGGRFYSQATTGVGSANLEGVRSKAVITTGTTGTIASLIGTVGEYLGQATATTATLGIGVDAEIFESGTLTTGHSLRATASILSGGNATALNIGSFALANSGTITTVKGLNVGGWTNSGAVGTSYGIYIDSTIDVGSTKYALYSLSTSPSLFTGNLTVSGLLKAGSGPTTLTDSAGKILSASLNTVAVAQGGTGQTSYTDGQLLIGNTSTGGLSKATLTAGANVTITNGNGSITIAATGGGGGGISGSGTTGTIPYFSASTTLADSILSQTSSLLTVAGGVNITGTNFGSSGIGNPFSLDATYASAGTSPLAGMNFTFPSIAAGSPTGLRVDYIFTGTGSGTTIRVNNVRLSHGASGTITTGRAYEAQLTNNGGGTVSTFSLFKGVLANSASSTVSDMRGLDLSGWSNSSATVTTSYGIYMDSSIDVGSTKYALYSLSASPSLLTGDLTVSGLLKAGSGPTTLTDSGGKVLSAALNTVGVAQGGTGQTSYTDGQLLIGNTSTGGLSKATLTAGSNITITNGNGSITIAASGGGGGTPGGSDTQLQRNAAGSFGGISGATSDGTNVTYGGGNLRATSPRITTDLSDSNGNELFKFTATASAVNEFTVTNAATGGNPALSATGSDSDISIVLTPKGGGRIKTASALQGTGSFLDLYSSSDNWLLRISSASHNFFGGGQAVFNVTTARVAIQPSMVYGFSSSSGDASAALDAGIARNAADVVEANNGTAGTLRDFLGRTIRHTALTVATLPTGVAGMVAYVTDGDASLAWGATAVNSGSGATKYLVWYNGTNWTIAGK